MHTLTDTRTLMIIALLGALCAALAWWLSRRRAAQRACRFVDALTHLPTRQGFMIRARAALLERAGDVHPAALLVLDLDRFRKINERHGRAAGDRALAHFGAILQRCTGPEDLLARVAGEEFCVLVSRDDAGDAMQVAQAILQETRGSSCMVGSERITLSVSIGVAHYAAGGTVDTMLARADRYLYLAKSRGGDQVLDREPRLRSRAWTGQPPVSTSQAPSTHWAT